MYPAGVNFDDEAVILAKSLDISRNALVSPSEKARLRSGL